MRKSIRRIIRDVPQHWVGDGFPVRSLFSYQDGNQFDPFLLLDYAGPFEFAPATTPRGVGEHPHRGFETVTIVYQGQLTHRDSSGSSGSLGPGDVQWMTAASGLVHEELHAEPMTRQGGTLEMVQLWVNLPAASKRTPPKYQEIVSDRIPVATLPDGAGIARVIAGEFDGTVGPASTFTPINVWDLRLRPGYTPTIEVPAGHTTLVVVQQGRMVVNDDEQVQGVELMELSREGTSFRLDVSDEAMVLVLTGEPIGEPVVGQGPFVMNTRDEIRQAIEDYHAGRMGHLS